MAERTPQTYKNHARSVPLYHYVALPLLLMNLLWSIYQVIQLVTFEALNALTVAFALIAIALSARVFALKAQDRIIRLEERLRMQEVLPDDLKERINDYTTDQLIALRFAGDSELCELARKVLDENIADRKTIKRIIQNWRPDYQRV